MDPTIISKRHSNDEIRRFVNEDNYDINTKKIPCFCTDGKISVRINLPLFSTVVPAIIYNITNLFLSLDNITSF